MQPILAVNHMSISAGTKLLVKDASFAIFPNECVALIGESGSGKTTLAYSILQLQSNTLTINGEIIYEDKNLLKLSDNEMRPIRAKKIAMIFQDPATSLNPTMRIGKQITEALPKPSKTKALELLELVNLPARCADQYPFQLSGGMQQRVLIAMALACNPEILIADEPTSALDIATQFQILNLLKEIQKKQKLSILFITHDLDAMIQFCDRVLILKSGEIVEDGTLQQILKTPKNAYTKALLEASYAS